MKTFSTTNLTKDTNTSDKSSCLLSALCEVRGFQIHERRNDLNQASSGVESNPFLCPVPCPQSPLCNSHVTQMSPLPHNKPHFSRTKLFPIAYTRTKPVTSFFYSAGARWLTQTIALARNHTARSTDDSAIHVGVMSKYFDTPIRTSLDFHGQNTRFATRRCRGTPTRNFYFPSAHLRPIASSRLPAHVRVFSEYSYIPNRTNITFLERNSQVEARKRKSTPTSFLNLRTLVGQAFLPDKCAHPSAKPFPIHDRIRQARKPDLHSSIGSSHGHYRFTQTRQTAMSNSAPPPFFGHSRPVPARAQICTHTISHPGV